MREAAVQSWPEFQYPATLIPSVTAAGSASSKTSTGALPPSSRCTRLRLSAAVRAMILPVSTSPVSETNRTSGCLTIASPAGTPSPVTTLRTPAGRISLASWANRSVVSGVCLDRPVDVLCRCARHLGDHLGRGRVQDLHRLAAGGVDPLAADQVLMLRNRRAPVPSLVKASLYRGHFRGLRRGGHGRASAQDT